MEHDFHDACVCIGIPLDNTIPTRLYPCICTTKSYQCLAILKFDIMVITTFSKNITHYIIQNLSLQFTEVIFCQDCDPSSHPKRRNIKQIPNTRGHSIRCYMVCHTHYPHNMPPRSHPHRQCHQLI